MTIRNLYPDTRPSLNLDFTNSKRLDPRITFTRMSIGTYTDESGIIRTAADNEARFDHDSDGNSLGLLIEEARTNYIDQSVDLTATGTWFNSNFNAPILNAGVAPDGTNTATSIVPNTSNVPRSFQCFNIATGFSNYLTFTAFVKANGYSKFQLWIDGASAGGFFGGRATFDVSTGTVTQGQEGVGSIQELPGGWYRCTITHQNTTGGIIVTPSIIGLDDSGNSVFTGDGTSGYLVWGFQLEEGSFPTSYIPTAGSTLQRGADIASMTGTNFSSWYNQSEGSWFVNYEATFGKEDTTVFTFNASNNNRIFSYTANNRVQFKYGGPTVNSNTATTTNDYAKAVMFYESDGTFGGSFEGTAVVSAAGTPNTATELNLAPFPGAGGALQSSTSHISRIAYYPVRLPDATLQALTL